MYVRRQCHDSHRRQPQENLGLSDLASPRQFAWVSARTIILEAALRLWTQALVQLPRRVALRLPSESLTKPRVQQACAIVRSRYFVARIDNQRTVRHAQHEGRPRSRSKSWLWRVDDTARWSVSAITFIGFHNSFLLLLTGYAGAICGHAQSRCAVTGLRGRAIRQHTGMALFVF